MPSGWQTLCVNSAQRLQSEAGLPPPAPLPSGSSRAGPHRCVSENSLAGSWLRKWDLTRGAPGCHLRPVCSQLLLKLNCDFWANSVINKQTGSAPKAVCLKRGKKKYWLRSRLFSWKRYIPWGRKNPDSLLSVFSEFRDGIILILLNEPLTSTEECGRIKTTWDQNNSLFKTGRQQSWNYMISEMESQLEKYPGCGRMERPEAALRTKKRTGQMQRCQPKLGGTAQSLFTAPNARWPCCGDPCWTMRPMSSEPWPSKGAFWIFYTYLKIAFFFGIKNFPPRILLPKTILPITNPSVFISTRNRPTK